MTKIIMANNNKWLLWGFIILAILNIILLGYIVMGIGGVSLGKGNVGLSPSGPASYCTDTSTGTFCFIGDKDGPTALELFRSKIIDSGTDYLEINSGAPKGVKINGDLEISRIKSRDNLLVPSTISGYANMINKDTIEINNSVRATAIKTEGICFYTSNARTVFCKVNPLVSPLTFTCELTEPALSSSPCYRNPTGNVYRTY